MISSEPITGEWWFLGLLLGSVILLWIGTVAGIITESMAGYVGLNLIILLAVSTVGSIFGYGGVVTSSCMSPDSSWYEWGEAHK